MTDLTELVDEVARRHYVERCALDPEPHPDWENIPPMLQHRLREWVMPTVAATVDLMVEGMKEASTTERDRIVAEVYSMSEEFPRGDEKAVARSIARHIKAGTYSGSDGIDPQAWRTRMGWERGEAL